MYVQEEEGRGVYMYEEEGGVCTCTQGGGEGGI